MSGTLIAIWPAISTLLTFYLHTRLSYLFSQALQHQLKLMTPNDAVLSPCCHGSSKRWSEISVKFLHHDMVIQANMTNEHRTLMVFTVDKGFRWVQPRGWWRHTEMGTGTYPFPFHLKFAEQRREKKVNTQNAPLCHTPQRRCNLK